MDISLVSALPRKRPYTLIEAVFSYQVDIFHGNKKGYREYARIWSWSVTKTIGFIRNEQGTKTEQARNTQETVKFRFIRLSEASKKQAGDKQETNRERAGNTTNKKIKDKEKEVETQKFIARYSELYKELYGRNPIIIRKDAGIAKRLTEYPEHMTILEKFFQSKDKFINDNCHSLSIIESQINKVLAEKKRWDEV